MRSQPNCFEFVLFCGFGCSCSCCWSCFVFIVVLNVDVVVQARSKVDLRLFVMEVEFGWVVGWVGGVQTHFRVKPNSVEVELGL